MKTLAACVWLAAVGCSGVDTCPNDLPTSCPATVPSYDNDIAVIISGHCVSCHSPGGVEASRPLNTYETLYQQRSSVLDQVYACRMPQAPDPSLSTQERETLLAWLVCNAPQN